MCDDGENQEGFAKQIVKADTRHQFPDRTNVHTDRPRSRGGRTVGLPVALAGCRSLFRLTRVQIELRAAVVNDH